MIRLGINVDHVATLRQARGEKYPDPVNIAVLCELAGADNITMHLREDRRHIQDHDVHRLKEVIQIPLNLEIAANRSMIDFAKKVMPHSVTLVPEKREERTTEGGLDLKRSFDQLQSCVDELNKCSILTSLFIEPSADNVVLSKKINAKAVEFHTGQFCRDLSEKNLTIEQRKLVDELSLVSEEAHDLGLQCHFGHGLNYQNAFWINKIKFAEEANIGHAVISRALFCGISEAIHEMKRLLNG